MRKNSENTGLVIKNIKNWKLTGSDLQVKLLDAFKNCSSKNFQVLTLSKSSDCNIGWDTSLKLLLHHPYNIGLTQTVDMATRWQEANINKALCSSSGDTDFYDTIQCYDINISMKKIKHYWFSLMTSLKDLKIWFWNVIESRSKQGCTKQRLGKKIYIKEHNS